METQTVTLTKREAAMKMSLDMIREWCCSNLKGKKAVKIAISYVIGKAIIITYNTIDTLDLSMLALQRTRKILANANFDAMMNY